MIVEVDINLEDFSNKEIEEYAKKYLRMFSEEEVIEVLSQIKKESGGIGEWVNMKESIKELIGE